jgi:hypothetical protein
MHFGNKITVLVGAIYSQACCLLLTTVILIYLKIISIAVQGNDEGNYSMKKS